MEENPFSAFVEAAGRATEAREIAVDFYELVEPLGNRMVVLKPRGADMPAVRKLKSGLFAPQVAEYLARELGIVCQVTKVGPDVTGFKPGDTVLIAQYGGIPLSVSGGEVGVWMVAEGDVLARVDPRFWELVGESGLEPPPAAPPAALQGVPS